MLRYLYCLFGQNELEKCGFGAKLAIAIAKLQYSNVQALYYLTYIVANETFYLNRVEAEFFFKTCYISRCFGVNIIYLSRAGNAVDDEFRNK